MSFAEKLEKKKIGEWQEAYVLYRLGKTHLKPFKVAQKLLSKIVQKVPIDDEEMRDEIEDLSHFETKFLDFIREEKDKYLMFLSLKLSEIIEEYDMIKVNLAIIEERKAPHNMEVSTESKEKQIIDDLETLRLGMKEFYRKTHKVQSYLNINYEALRKLIKRHQKIAEPFGSELNIRKLDIHTFFHNTSFAENQKNIKLVIEKTRKYFLKLFYNRFTKEKGLNELKRATVIRQISVKDSQRLFFFLGCIFSLSIVLLLMSIAGVMDPDNDNDFRPIFEMFRGSLLIILYFWLLGWNVYVWNRCHINYRKIFKFTSHYSTLPAIFKRAAFLISVWLIMFLWYLLIKEDYNSFNKLLPKEYTPFVIYIVIFLYLLMPTKRHFNGQGRLYMFRLLGRIFFFCCYKVDFVINWGTDQLVSFVVPLQDLEYTFCYYITTWIDEDTNTNCQRKGINVGFLAALIPYFLRMSQVFRVMKEKNDFRGLDLINFFKYFTSLCVVIVSMLAGYLDNSSLFYLWIALAIISSIYSYIWDVRVDWRFFQPHSKFVFLRNKRSYAHLYIYYFAMLSNLIMRFSWVFAISPAIMNNFIRAEVFTFFVALIEIFRRAIWNFFRVEREHIETCGDQLYVNDPIQLPYRNIKIVDRQESLIQSNKEAESINPLSRETVHQRMAPFAHSLSFEEGDEGMFAAKKSIKKILIKDNQIGVNSSSILQILEKNRTETISLRVAEENLIRERFISRPTLYQKRENLKKEVNEFTKRVRKSLTNLKNTGRKQEAEKKDDQNQFSLLGISSQTKDFNNIEERSSEFGSEKKEK